MVKCSSRSASAVAGVEAFVTAVKHRHSQSMPGVDKLFEPVRIHMISDFGTLTQSYSRFFSAIVHVSQYDRPYLNSKDLPYEYEFIFDQEGIYEITVVAHGQGAPEASITIEMLLRRTDQTDSSGKPFTEYEIAWVRST
jgi:hypothetical protein